jgi:multiple antibiotic resistance protein
MFKVFEPYLLTFIAIFVAVDAIGNIPLFTSLVEGMNKRTKKMIIIDSVVTATVLAILFTFLGKAVLRFIGITIPDFQIAGGALLFIIASRLLLPAVAKGLASRHDKEVGVFPLGTPLITGPAVLTTTLMMRDSYGLAPTLISLILNMLIVWFTLQKSELIIKAIGPGGSRAFAKIMYILLAAIGVMMIRKGIMGAFLK